MGRAISTKTSRALNALDKSRNELKSDAEQGNEKAAAQLAALRNIDKMRKRYNRARKAYEQAKEECLKII